MTPTTLDVRADVCPITWVRTRLCLETLPAGAQLQVLLRGEAAKRNLPRSAAEDGHRVLSLEPDGAGDFRLVLQKGTGEDAWPRS
jgi:tRNA 2-thiouridine synthesizing protein A